MLCDLEQCSWQMASCNSHPMFSWSDPGPTASDLGLTQVIDTCECVSSNSDKLHTYCCMFEPEFLAPHFEMPLFFPNVQPIVVVYLIVAVMHKVLGLSPRDCSQLLFAMKLLINLMVEDFLSQSDV